MMQDVQQPARRVPRLQLGLSSAQFAVESSPRLPTDIGTSGS
jgi:hypothetical protein